MSNVALGPIDFSSDGPTITTRDQMAALATGCHPRCGRHGALLAIMGPHHAHHFVRDLLWSDFVLPTLKSFLLEVTVSSTTPPTILSLVLSPVLFSLFRGPARMPYSGFHHHGRFVDPTHTAVLDYSGSSHVTVYDLLAGKTNTKAVLAPPKEGPHGWQRHSCNSWSSNSRWGVIAYLPDSEDATSCDNNAVTSFAAIVPIGSVLGGCCACEREGGGEESRSFVVVKMPLFVGGGANLLQLRMQVQMDECAASEAIITQYTESVVAIVVVDVESTYRSGKSLVVLSATKWEVPSGHSFLRVFVLRGSTRATRRRCANICGDCDDGVSRVFIVQSRWDCSVSVLFCVEEGTGSCQPIPLLDGFKVDRVYQVTNSLFCVSFRTSGLHGKKLAVYHCDDVNHPTLILAGERGETTPPCRFTAQGGFIFKVLSDKIAVLEPFQGNTVLTIHFPGFKRWVSLMTTPFSCFLSSSQY